MEARNETGTVEARPSLEERMARVEGLLEGVREEIKGVHRRIDDVYHQISEVHRRIDRLVMWLVGLMLTTWVTIMLTLIAILFKLR